MNYRIGICLNYCNFCFTNVTSSDEYFSSNANTWGSVVDAVASSIELCPVSLLLSTWLSWGRDGTVSIVAELVELAVIEVSVRADTLSLTWCLSASTILLVRVTGIFSLSAALALHFFQRLLYLVCQLTDCVLMVETAVEMAATTSLSSVLSFSSHLARLYKELNKLYP